MTTDPAGQHYSPYQGMGNNPVSQVDPDGAWHRDADGNLVPDVGDLQDINNTLNNALDGIQGAVGDTYNYSFKTSFSNGPETFGNFTAQESMFNVNIDFTAGNMNSVGGIGIFSAEASVSYLNVTGSYKLNNNLTLGGDVKLASASVLAKASTFSGESRLTGFDFGGKAGAYLFQAKGIYNRTFDSGLAYDAEGSFNLGIGLGSNYSIIYDQNRQVLTAKGFVSATLGVGGSLKGTIHVPLSNLIIQTIEFKNHLQNHFK